MSLSNQTYGFSFLWLTVPFGLGKEGLECGVGVEGGYNGGGEDAAGLDEVLVGILIDV